MNLENKLLVFLVLVLWLPLAYGERVFISSKRLIFSTAKQCQSNAKAMNSMRKNYSG